MKEKIKNLYNEDNNSAYKTLLELEIITTESNELYNYFNEFLNMLNNEKTFIRVRGFRLICSLAKWDNENKINKNIDIILKELEDEKGTSVRQCLEKLNLILMHKIELADIIENKIRNLELSKYKESMQFLIKKDIDYIRAYLPKEKFKEGITVKGIVRETEKSNNGIFIELAPNLVGLAEFKDGMEYGQSVDVYIKRILPDKHKVKLIIV